MVANERSRSYTRQPSAVNGAINRRSARIRGEQDDHEDPPTVLAAAESRPVGCTSLSNQSLGKPSYGRFADPYKNTRGDGPNGERGNR